MTRKEEKLNILIEAKAKEKRGEIEKWEQARKERVRKIVEEVKKMTREELEDSLISAKTEFCF